MARATFNAPPNNYSTFTTCTFGSEFASGLTRVENPVEFWALDSPVCIPEPGTHALHGMSMLAVVFHKFNPRWRI